MNTKSFNLDKFIASCVEQVDARLNDLVPTAAMAPRKLHEAMRHSIFAGGKRFRPALVLAVGETFEIESTRLITVASAIELIHTYSLIHDDLPAMDDDDFRRGRQTSHKKYGEATAILAGDALETLAFQSIAEDETLDAQIRVTLICEMARAAGTPKGMVAGQQVDLESEGKQITAEELESIHREKTGAIIEFSARSAAIIARANQDELAAITEYAGQVGLLFQITDDILDVTQTSEVLGKTAGKDENAEKVTYPSFFGLEGTRKLAMEAYETANLALLQLDRDVSRLRAIADFILRRTA